MTSATATSPRQTIALTSRPESASIPRESTTSPEQARSLLRAALFCAALGLSLVSLAIAPEIMNREYVTALLMAPLALAAGTCFGGILSLVVFFDEKHA